MTAPSDGFVLGVDLGTSHTVAMLRRPDGRTRPLLFDGQPLLPSAVYRDSTGRLHVGRDAQRLGYAEPDRFEPHPKRHIDADSVLLGGSGVPVADLLAALLGAVAREAVAVTGFLPPAVLTYPAGWGPRRRDVLMAAIAQAGWPPSTRLVPEPVAAARYFADVLRRPVPVGSAVAVFDFGAGTLDVAVVRHEGRNADGRPRFVVAASGGLDDLGGLDLDAALVEHLGESLAASEPPAWAALTEPVTLAQWRARRQFWEDVRGAKEMLSRTGAAPVPVPGVESAALLTRDELEAAIDPLIRRAVTEAADVIGAAGLTVGDLAGLFLVGGSTRVPMVARLLHAELGIAPLVLEQPELPVAEGAIVTLAAESVDAAGAAAEAAAPNATNDLTATAPHPAPEPESAAGTEWSVPAQAVPDHDRPDHDRAFSYPEPEGAARPGRGVADGLAGAAAGSYQPGVASAATPTPTPHTVPDRPRSAPVSPAPHYTEPVDPWATAEAAAIAAAGGASYLGSPTQDGPSGVTGVDGLTGLPRWGGPGTPNGKVEPTGSKSWLASEEKVDEPTAPAAARGGSGSSERAASPGLLRRAYRSKVVWAGLVLVVGVAATLVVVLWPGYRSLDYRPLGDAVHIAPAGPVSSSFTDAEVLGDRAYFASADNDGRLGVVAASTGGKRIWGNTEAGVATRWATMVALPDGVAVFTDTDSATSRRRMIVLGASDGKIRWQRSLDSRDQVYFVGEVAVLVDAAEHRLVGLKINDGGRTAWELPDRKTDSGTTTAVVPVTTVADVSGPARVDGRASAPNRGDDTRIVQLSADSSARVIDAKDGRVVVQPRQSVATPNDEVIAHNGRLFVREDTGAHRIVAYDLAKLGEPKVLYTAADTNHQISDLAPCGDRRVCFIERIGYAAKDARVVSVDADKGDHWSRAVPDADALVPVGESVLVNRNTSPDSVTLLDGSGKTTWARSGVAARLNAGNLLMFSEDLSTVPGGPAVSGQHLGDDVRPLGALSDVRTTSCSWDTAVLACVGDKDFVLQKFAG